MSSDESSVGSATTALLSAEAVASGVVVCVGAVEVEDGGMLVAVATVAFAGRGYFFNWKVRPLNALPQQTPPF